MERSRPHPVDGEVKSSVRAEDFLRRAASDGAFLRAESELNTQRGSLRRSMANFYLNTDFSLDEAGEIFGGTGERVRQNIKSLVDILYEHASSELKLEISREAIVVGKEQVRPIKTNEEPVGLIEKKRLKEEELLQKIKGASSHDEYREILVQLDRAFVQRYREYFISGRQAIRSSGFRFKVDRQKDFFDVLDEQNYPYARHLYVVSKGKTRGREQRYFWFLTNQFDEVSGIWKGSRKLEQHKELKSVSQVGGPESVIPSSLRFKRRDRLVQVNGAIMNSELEIGEIFGGSPVPIYKYHSMLFVADSDYDALIGFVESIKSGKN